MEAGINFSEDLRIAKLLINRDEAVTQEFFYKKCYPLFKSVYDHYYSDCETCLEFINQMYLVVLSPSKVTGRCQMENYRGEASLPSWLKAVCVFYCNGRYRKKTSFPINLVSLEKESEKLGGADRLAVKSDSYDISLRSISKGDLERLICLMPNKRYQLIIRYLYVEHLSIEEVAIILGMKTKSFYAKHALAKAQLAKVIREDERYAKR